MEKDFQDSLERLLVNWPIDEKRLRVLSVELHKVFQEVGTERFAAATDSIIRQHAYSEFPTIAEFRGYIPAPVKKVHCDKCQNGWIMVPDYQARALYKNQTAMCAVRCECRRGPKFQAYEKRVIAWTAPE